MKNLLNKIWKLIKLGLVLLGAVIVLHAAILVIHNATSKPTPPPGGWYPQEPGDENYVKPKQLKQAL